MAQLPEAVSQAWDERKGPVVFATCDKEGNPNAIYAGCVKKFNEEKLVVADNYFDKTRANIKSGSRGAIVFITEKGKSFQVKGKIEYLTEGEIFDDMKETVAKKYPGHAAAVLVVEEVYQGGEKLL